MKIYWNKHTMLEDGKYYNELVLETENTIAILLTLKCKQ